jgi:hypothetical protein
VQVARGTSVVWKAPSVRGHGPAHANPSGCPCWRQCTAAS